MREHYDFSKMKGKKNPYIKHLKQPVTIRLDCESVEYFKALGDENNIPYQTLINLYLRDCAMNQRKLQMTWADK
jgi:uncharacterized protein (DUF4415 family)